jgi:hypothetical protein
LGDRGVDTIAPRGSLPRRTHRRSAAAPQPTTRRRGEHRVRRPTLACAGTSNPPHGSKIEEEVPRLPGTRIKPPDHHRGSILSRCFPPHTSCHHSVPFLISSSLFINLLITGTLLNYYLPKPSSPSWLVELRYGRNHPGSIPRWSELRG